MNYAVVTKARAMYGRRVTAQQMEALTECQSLTELAEQLKAHPAYSDAFREVETRDIRIDRVELTLRKQYWLEFERLVSGLTDRERETAVRFIGLYELRFMTAALRNSNTDPTLRTPLRSLYMPLLKKYSELDVEALYAAQTAAEVTEALPERYRKAAEPAVKDGHVDLLAAENALWKSYYSFVAEYLEGHKDADLKALFGTESDMQNVLRIYRLREHFGYSPEEVTPYILSPLYRLRDRQVTALCSADGAKAFRAVLAETAYRRLAEAESGTALERLTQSILAEKAQRTLHFSQSTAAIIYAYMILKTRETESIKTIAESVRYQLSREMIRDYVGTKAETN